jgi:hypothetical protein
VVVIVELQDRRVFDAVKAFALGEPNCSAVGWREKVVGFDGNATIGFATVECGETVLGFAEGLGVFSVLVSVGDVDVVLFSRWPSYGVVATIAVRPRGEERKGVTTVTEGSFEHVHLAYDVVEAVVNKVSLKQLYTKIEEVGRKQLEGLWPARKPAYAASRPRTWCALSLSKLLACFKRARV